MPRSNLTLRQLRRMLASCDRVELRRTSHGYYSVTLCHANGSIERRNYLGEDIDDAIELAHDCGVEEEVRT